MFCSECGAQVDDGAKFCSACGSTNGKTAGSVPGVAPLPAKRPKVRPWMLVALVIVAGGAAAFFYFDRYRVPNCSDEATVTSVTSLITSELFGGISDTEKNSFVPKLDLISPGGANGGERTCSARLTVKIAAPGVEQLADQYASSGSDGMPTEYRAAKALSGLARLGGIETLSDVDEEIGVAALQSTWKKADKALSVSVDYKVRRVEDQSGFAVMILPMQLAGAKSAITLLAKTYAPVQLAAASRAANSRAAAQAAPAAAATAEGASNTVQGKLTCFANVSPEAPIECGIGTLRFLKDTDVGKAVFAACSENDECEVTGVVKGDQLASLTNAKVVKPQ